MVEITNVEKIQKVAEFFGGKAKWLEDIQDLYWKGRSVYGVTVQGCEFVWMDEQIAAHSVEDLIGAVVTGLIEAGV